MLGWFGWAGPAGMPHKKIFKHPRRSSDVAISFKDHRFPPDVRRDWVARYDSFSPGLRIDAERSAGRGADVRDGTAPGDEVRSGHRHAPSSDAIKVLGAWREVRAPWGRYAGAAKGLTRRPRSARSNSASNPVTPPAPRVGPPGGAFAPAPRGRETLMLGAKSARLTSARLKSTPMAALRLSPCAGAETVHGVPLSPLHPAMPSTNARGVAHREARGRRKEGLRRAQGGLKEGSRAPSPTSADVARRQPGRLNNLTVPEGLILVRAGPWPVCGAGF